VVAVVDPRAGHEPDPVTEDVEAPPEVDVLEEREVRLVEPPDPEERRRPRDHRPARGEQGVAVGALVDIDAVDAPCEAVAVERQLPTGEVHGAPVLPQDLARDAGDRRLRLQLVHGSAQPGGVGLRVVVDQREVGAVRELGPLVHRRGEPGVRVVHDDLNLGERRPDVLHRSVRGAVVDEDDLDLVGGIRLGAQRSEAALEVLPAVVVHDDDADRRPGAVGLLARGGTGAGAGMAVGLLTVRGWGWPLSLRVLERLAAA
jgi:hypothetical protein